LTEFTKNRLKFDWGSPYTVKNQNPLPAEFDDIRSELTKIWSELAKIQLAQISSKITEKRLRNHTNE
jgi:hypothetical protein